MTTRSGKGRRLTKREEDFLMLLKRLIVTCDKWIDRGSSQSVEQAREYVSRFTKPTDILRSPRPASKGVKG